MIHRTCLSRRRVALGVAAAMLLAGAPALADGTGEQASAGAAEAVRADARGFGDERFERLIADWRTEAGRVPLLAAIYEADAPKNPLAFPDGALPVSALELSAAAIGKAAAWSLREPGLVALPSSAPLRAARLTGRFGMRVHPILGGLRAHKGIDLAAAAGTPIRAAADGIVTQAAWAGGYGLLVAIDHGGRMETRYGHMARLAVAPGQRVTKDSVIGYVGSTGRSTGPHLHYEVLIDGRAVNPLAYMR